MTIQCKHSFHLMVAAILACSILVFASPQYKEDNSQVNLTVRTELVLIPTVVTDKSGNHITGLNKEDFAVLENGAERQVATFEEIRSAPGPLLYPAHPNEFSNFVAGQPSTGRITVIVLDFINTRFIDQAVGRQELLKYLTQSVDAREPTALYTLTRTGLQVVHDFATDPGVLVAALHRVKGDTYEMVDSPEEVESVTGTASPDGSKDNPSAPSTSSKTSGQSDVKSEAARIQAMLGDAALNFQSFEQRLAITYTLEGMQQIAQVLAGYLRTRNCLSSFRSTGYVDHLRFSGLCYVRRSYTGTKSYRQPGETHKSSPRQFRRQ